MYEWADEYLSANGYVQYEISNWAVEREPPTGAGPSQPSLLRPPSQACRHNLQYWRNLPYLGLGAGAHGYANGIRYSNVLRIKTYIDRLAPGSQPSTSLFPLTPGTVNHHRLTQRDEMQETMLTGLRLVREGVSDLSFRERFGVGIVEAFPKEIVELLHLKLIEWAGAQGDPHLRLTPQARLVSNQVFVRFVE
jgi:oxygen-independent coproporphyrinogen-3 oxidase